MPDDDTELLNENEDLRAAVATAKAQAASARAWVVLLMSDLSWMVGCAEGGGTQVPDRITDDLREALSWLAGDTP